MDPKTALLVIVAAANFILAVYVVYKNPKNVANQTFGLFALCTSLWNLFLFLVTISHDTASAVFSGQLCFAAASLIPSSFLAFTLVFPNPYRIKKARAWFIPIFLPGLVFCRLSFTDFLQSGIVSYSWGYAPIPGPGRSLLSLYAIGFAICGLLILARKYRGSTIAVERMQLKYTFAGIFVAAIVGSMTNVLLPMIGISRLQAVGPSSTLITAVAITYAIVKYRLMDINLALRSFVIYTSLILSTAALFAMALLIHQGFAPGQAIGRQALLVALLAALTASMLFQPMKKGIESLVDRSLFKGRYDYQKSLVEFSKTLVTYLDFNSLTQVIVDEIVAVMKVHHGSLMLRDDEKQHYRTMASHPPDTVKSAPSIDADSHLIREFQARRQIIVREEQRSLLPRDEYENIDGEMESLNSQLAIPLFSHGAMIGIINLGPKVSGDIFLEADVNLLWTLANQVVIALDNASLHREIVEVKDHLENVLKDMTSGVVAADRRGKITTFNRRAEEITEVTSQRAIGGNLDLLPPQLGELLRKTIDNGTQYRNSEVEVILGSRTVSLGVSTSALRGSVGEPAGGILVFSDLSEIKKLEADMRRADRLASLGTLAAGMAHEIKNPLVSIKTFSQLLPTKYQDSEFRQDFSNLAAREVDRINSIVDQLLNFARPSSPIFRAVNVHEVLDDTLLLLSSEISDKNITVDKNYSQHGESVTADNEQLRQVFLNLFINSVQAMSQSSSGTLSVDTRRQSDGQNGDDSTAPGQWSGTAEVDSTKSLTNNSGNGWMVISISDTGEGIPEEHVPHLFDPFFTTKEKGYGLGLAIAYSIIKEHRGDISVKSKVGAGTTFLLRLPLSNLTTHNGSGESGCDPGRVP